MNKSLFLLVAAIAITWLLKPYVFPSDEDKILNQARELVEIASVNGKENRLEQLRVSKNVSEFFVTNPLLQYKYSSNAKAKNLVKNREELQKKIFLARAILKKAHCTYSVKALKIEREKATMEVEAKVYWQTQREEKKFYAIHFAQIAWQKINGEWLIQSGESIPSKEEQAEEL